MSSNMASTAGVGSSLEDALAADQRNAVVIEVGTALTKCAFAGEPAPRFIFRTPKEVVSLRSVYEFGSNSNQSPLSSISDDDAVSGPLHDFFHDLYFKRLLVNPRERKVVITEDLTFPHRFKRLLLRVLFERYDVPGVVFVPTYVAALFAACTESAVVVDCGLQDTTIVPVYAGFPVAQAWEIAGVGGRDVFESFGKALDANIADAPTSDPANSRTMPPFVLEDAFIRTGFVASSSDSGALSSVVDCSYPLPNGKMLKVPAAIRASAAEALFGDNEDGLCIARSIADSILKCPIDVRSEVCGRIILIGGVAAWPGLSCRIRNELVHLFENVAEYAELKFLVQRLHIYRSRLPSNTVSWTGAAMIGALDMHLNDWITRADFVQLERRIPEPNRGIFVV